MPASIRDRLVSDDSLDLPFVSHPFRSESQLYSAWEDANVLCKGDFAKLQGENLRIVYMDIQREQNQMFVQVVMNDVVADTSVLPSTIKSLPVRAVVLGNQRGPLYRGA